MNHHVLVIGAGIGGISSALWLRDRHVDFDWVEAEADLGGTLRRVGNPIDELAGLRTRSGPALIQRYTKHLNGLGLTPQFNRRVAQLQPASNASVRVRFSDGVETVYDAVVLCTGTRPRTLGLPHEDALLGSGVELSVTRTRARYEGKRVAVVGGGDAALEGVLLLADVTDTLHIIHRRDAFDAQPRFVDAVTTHPNVTCHMERQVVALTPSADGKTLAGITLDNHTQLNVDGLFVRIGVEPTYPDGLVSPSANGAYLPQDNDGRGPLPGTYVVGDVGTEHHQSVGWAMGSAARAVLSLCQDLRARDA